jgi:hypothetical protein
VTSSIEHALHGVAYDVHVADQCDTNELLANRAPSDHLSELGDEAQETKVPSSTKPGHGNHRFKGWRVSVATSAAPGDNDTPHELRLDCMGFHPLWFYQWGRNTLRRELQHSQQLVAMATHPYQRSQFGTARSFELHHADLIRTDTKRMRPRTCKQRLGRHRYHKPPQSDQDRVEA